MLTCTSICIYLAVLAASVYHATKHLRSRAETRLNHVLVLRICVPLKAYISLPNTKPPPSSKAEENAPSTTTTHNLPKQPNIQPSTNPHKHNSPTPNPHKPCPSGPGPLPGSSTKAAAAPPPLPGISPRLGTGLTPAFLLLLPARGVSTAQLHHLRSGITSALLHLLFGVSTAVVVILHLLGLFRAVIRRRLGLSSVVVVDVLRLRLGFSPLMLLCWGVLAAAGSMAGSMAAV